MFPKFSRNLWLLWFGTIVSAIGNELNAIAFSVYVLQRYDSIYLMSLTKAFSHLPRAIGGMIAGPIVDHFPKVPILVICDVVRGLNLIVMAVSAYFFDLALWVVWAVAVTNSFLDAFFDTASQTVIPKVTNEGELVKTYSLFTTSNQIVEIGMKAASGLLLAFFGPLPLFIFDGVSFVLSGISEAFIKIKENTDSRAPLRFTTKFKEGILYLREKRDLFRLLTVLGLSNVFAIGGFVGLLPYCKGIEHYGLEYYGYFLSIGGFGYLVGALATAKIPPSKYYLIFCVSFLVHNLHWLLFLSHELAMISFVQFFVNGLFMSSVSIIVQTKVVESTDEQYLGRVMALLGVILTALSPLSMVLVGYSADIFGAKETMIATYTSSLGFSLLVVATSYVRSSFSTESN